MNELILKQLWIFSISILYGIGTGLWYEVFRILRKSIRHSDLVVHLEDICFWLSFAAGLFFLVQKYNYGSIRFYMATGIAVGLIVYYFILNKLAGNIIGFLFGRFLGLAACTGGIIKLPLKIIIKTLVKSLKKTKRTVRIIKSRI